MAFGRFGKWVDRQLDIRAAKSLMNEGQEASGREGAAADDFALGWGFETGRRRAQGEGVRTRLGKRRGKRMWGLFAALSKQRVDTMDLGAHVDGLQKANHRRMSLPR